MKKIILTSLALALGACGGSEDLSGQAAGSNSSGTSNINETTSNNDSTNNAQLVSLGSLIFGSAGSLDVSDYYKFTATEGQAIQINLTAGSNTDLDIQVLNEGGYNMYFSGNYDSTEAIAFTAEYTGTYYVYLYYYDGDESDYELVIAEDD